MRHVLAILCLAACSSSSPEHARGPYDDVPLAMQRSVPGLDGDTHVARDRFGIAHIYATSLADAGFAQGYVMAHDRLPQMDLLRRLASGKLSELFGALSSDVVGSDLEMRTYRLEATAAAALDEMRASD